MWKKRMEIMHQNNRQMKKKKQYKRPITHIIGIPKKKEREKRIENIF